jgi:hypothetical protein
MQGRELHAGGSFWQLTVNNSSRKGSLANMSYCSRACLGQNRCMRCANLHVWPLERNKFRTERALPNGFSGPLLRYPVLCLPAPLKNTLQSAVPLVRRHMPTADGHVMYAWQMCTKQSTSLRLHYKECSVSSRETQQRQPLIQGPVRLLCPGRWGYKRNKAMGMDHAPCILDGSEAQVHARAHRGWASGCGDF